jgi:transaldolase
VTPDTDATIAQACDLWQHLDQPNVMIKVPGTEAGLAAIEELTRRGVNVNITLLFGIGRYEQVIDAYLRGLTARAQAGESLAGLASVASFFLSRIDTEVDAQLPERTLEAFGDHGRIARTIRPRSCGGTPGSR